METMEIKIEKGIPIPGPVFVSELLALEVGDSFTFEESRHSAMRGAISEVKSLRPGWKFKTRVDVDRITRRRIWRIKDNGSN